MFELQFLGTGTSIGVPLIGCNCPVCSSKDPRDNRCRSSLYVTYGKRALLIDTPPDFRTQALRFGVPRIDAVAITHLHADHIFGFDDVRRYNTLQGNAIIPTYAHPETIRGMKRIFDYITQTPTKGFYRPLIDFVEQSTPFEPWSGMLVTPLPVVHGDDPMQGYRIDCEGHAIAYICDCHYIPESTLELLHDLDIMILDGLRHAPHRTHLTIDEALDYFERIQAKDSYLTHLSHDVTQAEFDTTLPQGVHAAYDGLSITL